MTISESIKSKLLPTTVVGSYPFVQGSGLKAKLNPFSAPLKTAVDDQIKAGIDFISSGQIRGDMITSLTEHIPGINGQNVVGNIRPADKPMTAADTKYAVSMNKTKAMLAGPSTIACALKIDTPAYRSRNELIIDLAGVLAAEAKLLDAAGASIFQVDEPILSTGIADMDTAAEAVGIVVKDLKCTTCIHVCGDIDKVIDKIIAMPVDIIDLEFSCNQSNLDCVSRSDFKGKMVGFGAVNSAVPEVESVEEIKSRIRRGIEIFGADKMLVDPDCGLRMHTRETAFAKLSNMCRAAAEIREEL